MIQHAEQQQLQMTADYEASMLSLKAEHSRQMEQEQATLSAQHTSDMEVHRQDIAALEKELTALHSQVERAESQAAVLHSQLDQELSQVQQLRTQLDAKVQLYLMNGLQSPSGWNTPYLFSACNVSEHVQR